jgi:hypothetical protein
MLMDYCHWITKCQVERRSVRRTARRTPQAIRTSSTSVDVSGGEGCGSSKVEKSLWKGSKEEMLLPQYLFTICDTINFMALG